VVKKDIVIIGSSSEIAVEFIKICVKNSENVISISRSSNVSIEGIQHTQINDYLDDYENIRNIIKKLSNPIIIFFNGFLAENRMHQFPTDDEIAQTDKVNFLIPYTLSQKLNTESNNISKYIYISTLAAIKPRYKNYIYGLSKRKLEESVKYINLPSVLIVRYGKVETKMSKEHKNPPFTLSSEKAASILYTSLDSTGTKYASFGLLCLGKIIKILPMQLIRKIKS